MKCVSRLLLALLAGGALGAAENVMQVPAKAVAGARYVEPRDVDFVALLPPPPAPDSLAAQADVETVLQVQAARTPDAVAWAQLIDRDEVFNHAAQLGAWFRADRLPRTAEFFKVLGEDLRAFDRAAKAPFRRDRPWVVDARVQPCVPRPTSSSYPSGSALQSTVWAELLGEVFPAQREALRARADRAGWGRVIGGVHFPTDVVAGRRLAPVFLAACRAKAEFQADFAAVRAELLAAARN